jgi:hypothetical protein
MTFTKGHPGYTPVQSEEHKRKKNLACSISMKGKHNSPKSEFKKGMTPWNKGKECLAVKGESNHHWKGDNAGYVSIHMWVSRWKGRPKLCDVCGSTQEKKYEWANIDHRYKRVLDDYIRMCTRCHRKYDKEMGVKIN